MTNTEKFILQANSGDKLDLSPSNARFKVWFCLALSTLLFTCIASFLILKYGLNWTTLSYTLLLLLTFGITIIIALKDYSIVTVKSGNLIISEWNKNRYLVASVRSVNNVNTIKLGSIRFTSFKFHLDGRSRRAVIIKRLSDTDPEPEKVLRKLKEEKEKANL